VRSAALAAGAGAGAAWALPALAPVVPGLAGLLRIATRCALPGAVALTFDDGPQPRGTPAVLDALAAAGVRATFFLVGEQVGRHPALAAEIVAAGHAVGFHGGRHRSLLRLPPRALARDLDAGADVLASVLGLAPSLHRPPLGIYSWPALAAVRARGWTPVLWSRWGRDWTRRATAESVARRAAQGVRDGDVLLLHDADTYSAPGCWKATVAALPRVLEQIAAAGLRAEPLSGAADLVQPVGR
jgi:peptidoglycan/xylan/chitin deacetylase (PgdA/CDA1 family)